MESAVKILPHYTYEDYVQQEGRRERIEGAPYTMSPLPVSKHQLITLNMTTEFNIGHPFSCNFSFRDFKAGIILVRW